MVRTGGVGPMKSREFLLVLRPDITNDPVYQRLHQPTQGEAMYSLIQTLGVQASLKRELLPFLVAFTIAEFFFKFKSFTLECIAFLLTWIVLSYLQSLVIGRQDDDSNRSLR
jgi:hypothetical protein